MHTGFIDLDKAEQIKILTKKKIKTQVLDDMFEVSGDIKDIDILENEYEYFIVVTFGKDDIFNERVLVLYDEDCIPLGKMAYSINDKDAKISFDYFFVRKDLRGQGLGQSMIDLFLDKMNEQFDGYFEVYTNPYSFDVSFNGIKGYNYESQLHQYKLEQFYINNGFLLTEEPKKYAFSDIEYIPESYTLTPIPQKSIWWFYN